MITPTTYIRLLGSLRVQRGIQVLECLQRSKVQELFCYLLLHRDRRLSREALASLLWSECGTSQSKKYFRQVLWQLQLNLHVLTRPTRSQLLFVEGDGVRLRLPPGFWLDVAEFERASSSAQGCPGEQLDPQRAQALEEAVALYRGDLLEGWYQDWCLFERERLHNLYLGMLDKLMACCEARRDYEKCLAYGEKILCDDRAHERTHLRMMRARYLAGDRAGALRQYEHCVAALQEDLNVRPALRTAELYEQICADRVEIPASRPAEPAPPAAPAPLPEVLERLKRLRSILGRIQRRLQLDIQSLDHILTPRADRSFFHKH